MAKYRNLEGYKTTEYYEFTRVRSDRLEIKDEWILQAINQPLEEAVQSDGRIRRWVLIEEIKKARQIIIDRTIATASTRLPALISVAEAVRLWRYPEFRHQPEPPDPKAHAFGYREDCGGTKRGRFITFVESGGARIY